MENNESSSSTPSSSKKPQVFLSFRGMDTRTNFTNHLYDALQPKGYEIFMDSESLKRGKDIAPELIAAIEASQFAIVVFSKNYAFSKWCLKELAKILDCRRNRGLAVYPVFYHVDPADLRKLRGEFVGEAFIKHKTADLHPMDMETVESWQKAVTQLADIAGRHVLEYTYEAEVLGEIVKVVSETLDPMLLPNVIKDNVGIESRIDELELYLHREADDARVVAIWGIGGIGKTVIAKEVFERIRCSFDASGIFFNISNEHNHSNRCQHCMIRLQEQIHEHFFKCKGNIQTVDLGATKIKQGLSSKKVLIVLDDVDKPELIEAVAGKPGEQHDWFGSKSRIIVTTRNRELLKEYGDNYNNIYEVKKLTNDEGLRLFYQKVFKNKYPPNDVYKELSSKFIEYACGLPLALSVLSRLLYEKNEDQWNKELEHLADNPNEDISKVLRLSYDPLPKMCKRIFLDIACFFNGEDEYRVTKIFESCNFNPARGIPALVDRSLITIQGGKVLVHDLLKQMAWHIIREEIEDGRRSRSYHHEDALRLLEGNKETTTVEGIFLTLPSQQEIDSDPFSSLTSLRLLKICNVKFSGLGDEVFLSRELRLLEWHEYPLKSIATIFRLKRLVELNIPNSRIQQLWKETDLLKNLVLINLSNCEYLTKIPDFSMVPNLEKLILEGCKSLSEIHQSIEVLEHLVLWNMKGCKNLQRLPKKISLKSLATFILSGCSNLKEFPEISGEMKNLSELNLDGTAIRELPISVNRLTGLTLLSLRECKNLLSLPNGILCSLKSLKSLNFSGCVSMGQLPEDLPRLEILEELFLDGTAMRTFPSSILLLKNLKLLSLRRYGVVPHKLWKSLLSFCSLPFEFFEFLDLKLPDDISRLSSLQQLDLSESNLRSIPESISQLSELIDLRLSKCRNLRSLPKHLPSSLKILETCDCPMLITDGLDSMIVTSVGNRFQLVDSRISSGVDGDYTSKAPLAMTHVHADLLIGENIKELIDDGKHFEIRFPSSRIPEWFHHLTRESTLRIELNPDDPDRNPDRKRLRKGFALFAVFEIKEHENFDGGRELNSISSEFRIDEQRLKNSLVFADLKYFKVGSYAVCSYLPLRWFAGQLNALSRVMDAKVSTKGTDIELRMFGMHEVFEQGAEDFSNKLAQSANDHLELELNFIRHCKKLLDGGNELLEGSSDIVEVVRKQYVTDPNRTAWDNIPSSDNKSFINETYALITRLFQGSFARQNSFSLAIPSPVLSQWFFHHSVGNETLCYLPPNICNDKRWLGLELYVQCKRRRSDSASSVASLEVRLFAHGERWFPVFSRRFKTNMDSFVAFHIARDELSESVNVCKGISAFFRSTASDVEVKMCGTRLLYEQDSKLISKGIIEDIFTRSDLLSHVNELVKGHLDRNAVEQEIVWTDDQPRERKRIVLKYPQELLTSTEQVAKDVSTSLLNHIKEHAEGQGRTAVESDPVLFHSKKIFLENRDRIKEDPSTRLSTAFSHLHIMAETLLQAINSEDQKETFYKFLEEFFKHRFLVTFSRKGHIIFVLRHFHPSSPYNLYFPHEGIPNWFVHKKINTKVTVELPPNLSPEKSWRGLVICASFSVKEHADTSPEASFKLLCHLASEGQCLNPIAQCSITKDKFKWLHYQRTFIWLAYIPHFMLTELSRKPSVEARIYNYCPSLIVDKCGIRLLYEEDVEGLQQMIIQGCTSVVKHLHSSVERLSQDHSEDHA